MSSYHELHACMELSTSLITTLRGGYIYNLSQMKEMRFREVKPLA